MILIVGKPGRNAIPLIPEMLPVIGFSPLGAGFCWDLSYSSGAKGATYQTLWATALPHWGFKASGRSQKGNHCAGTGTLPLYGGTVVCFCGFQEVL